MVEIAAKRGDGSSGKAPARSAPSRMSTETPVWHKPEKDEAEQPVIGAIVDDLCGKRCRRSFGSRSFWGTVAGCYWVGDGVFYKVSFDDGDVDILSRDEVLSDIHEAERHATENPQTPAASSDEPPYRELMRSKKTLKRRRDDSAASATSVSNGCERGGVWPVKLWGVRLYASIVDRHGLIYINELVRTPDGEVGEMEATGKVKVGDVIIAIQGTNARGLGHVQASDMIRGAARPITLTLFRPHSSPGSPVSDSASSAPSPESLATGSEATRSEQVPPPSQTPVGQDGSDRTSHHAPGATETTGNPALHSSTKSRVHEWLGDRNARRMAVTSGAIENNESVSVPLPSSTVNLAQPSQASEPVSRGDGTSSPDVEIVGVRPPVPPTGGPFIAPAQSVNLGMPAPPGADRSTSNHVAAFRSGGQRGGQQDLRVFAGRQYRGLGIEMRHQQSYPHVPNHPQFSNQSGPGSGYVGQSAQDQHQLRVAHHQFLQQQQLQQQQRQRQEQLQRHRQEQLQRQLQEQQERQHQLQIQQQLQQTQQLRWAKQYAPYQRAGQHGMVATSQMMTGLRPTLSQPSVPASSQPPRYISVPPSVTPHITAPLLGRQGSIGVHPPVSTAPPPNPFPPRQVNHSTSVVQQPPQPSHGRHGITPAYLSSQAHGKPAAIGRSSDASPTASASSRDIQSPATQLTSPIQLMSDASPRSESTSAELDKNAQDAGQTSFLSPDQLKFIESLPAMDIREPASRPSTESQKQSLTTPRFIAERNDLIVVTVTQPRLYLTLAPHGSAVSVSSFVAGEGGERGEIERSGKVLVGDILVGVGAIEITPYMMPSDVAKIVRDLSRPFKVYFERASWEMLTG